MLFKRLFCHFIRFLSGLNLRELQLINKPSKKIKIYKIHELYIYQNNIVKPKKKII